MYFECKPPFNEKRKKYEFLDAFILLTIEDWCNKNESKAILFSTDSDQLNYKSKNFTVESEFSSFLENFVDKSLKIKNIPVKEKIDELLKINSDSVFKQIKYLFEAEFVVILSNPKYNLESLKALKIDMVNYKVLSANESKALLECSVSIHYTFSLSEINANYEREIVIIDDDFITIPFEIMLKLDQGIRKGGYELIKVDLKSTFKKIKINCG